MTQAMHHSPQSPQPGAFPMQPGQIDQQAAHAQAIAQAQAAAIQQAQAQAMAQQQQQQQLMYGGAPQLAPGQPPAQQMFPQPQQPQQSQQPGVPPGHVAIQTPHGVMVIPAPGGVPTSQPVGPVPVIPGTPQHAAIPMIPGQQGAQPMLPGHPVGVNPHARMGLQLSALQAQHLAQLQQ